MTAVPMGFEIEQIKAFEDKKTLKRNYKKNVVYLGTLLKSRKLDMLIRAFSIVKKKFKNCRLTLVGSGVSKEDEEFLNYEIKKFNLENDISITGMLPQIEAWNYVKNADVCVSPIYPSPILNCGSPTKLIEYMALAKAVVANDHPEQKEILEQSKGGVIVQWEEREFANAIIKLLNDPVACQRFGVKGYDTLSEIVDRKLASIM